MKKKFLTLLYLCLSLSIVAQETEVNKDFKQKPVVNLFTNYHYNFEKPDNSGFELIRALIGYRFEYKGQLKGEFNIDFGDTKIDNSALDFVAFIKNAYVAWSNYGVTASMGMIRTNNFALQERVWGRRYVAKCFLDEQGFAPSADLGLSVAYDYKWFSADLQVINGEGYKRISIDNNQSYGLGLTFEPVDKLFIRGYYNIYTPINAGGKGEHTASLFTGYMCDRFSIGAEFNYKWNKKFAKGVNNAGTTIYTNVKIIDKLFIFARYDYAMYDVNKSYVYGGIEYEPFKYLQISPNVQSVISHVNGESDTRIYLSVQVRI